MLHRYIAIASVLLAMPLHASDVAAQQRSRNNHLTLPLRIATWNVCKDNRAQGDYKDLNWQNRKQHVTNFLTDENTKRDTCGTPTPLDVIGFQEVRNGDGGCMEADIWQALGEHYHLVTWPFNGTPLSFINAIAYNKNRFHLNSVQSWYASETPGRFSDPWGNGFGRLMLMITLYPLIKHENQICPVPDYDRGPLHFVNIHHGLKHEEKLNSQRVLKEQIEQRTESQGVTFITGDFNSFPNPDKGDQPDQGEQELNVLKNAGYQELLDELKTRNHVPVSGTFVGYSFDGNQCPEDRFGAQLDHIFTNKPDKIHNRTCYVNASRCNARDTDMKHEAQLLQDKNGKSMHDKFPSDHLTGIVEANVNI